MAEDRVFHLGTGKSVDITKALPLTLGDLRRLKKEHGFDLEDFNKGLDAEKLYSLASYVMRRADKDLTEADVESLVLGDLGRFSLAVVSSTAVAKEDRPTTGS